MSRSGMIFAIGFLAAIVLITAAIIHRRTAPHQSWSHHCIQDNAGILGSGLAEEYDQDLSLICRETGIDMRILTVGDLQGKTLEQFASDEMNSLGIGGKGSRERGVLMVYDAASGNMRIEIGYGLEPYLTDLFAGNAIRTDLEGYFKAGNPKAALFYFTDDLMNVIRSQELKLTYDPSPVRKIGKLKFLSGGAGGSASVSFGHDPNAMATGTLSPKGKRYFSAQPTVEQAWKRYREWIENGVYDPNIDLFTPSTSQLLVARPRSEAVFLSMDPGDPPHGIYERGNYAILYFTRTPLHSPFFFRKTPGGWQMDILNSEHSVRWYIGGEYSWGFIAGCEFCRVFNDKIVEIHTDSPNGHHYQYLRLKGEDNRQLPVHGDCPD